MVLLIGRPVVFRGFDGDPQCIIGYVKGYENKKLVEVMVPVMVKDITSAQRFQLEACVIRALSCCEVKAGDKPKLIQVAKELEQIQASLTDPS